MYNWTVDTKKLQKNKAKFAVWKLEQLINYGLNGEKLSRKLLKIHWNKLRVDKRYKKYLEFLLWPNQF